MVVGAHPARGRVPVERLETPAQEGPVLEPVAGRDQGLRQPGVVVGQHVLEPGPVGPAPAIEPPGEPTSEARQRVGQRRRQARQIRPGEAEDRERQLARGAGQAQGTAHLGQLAEAAGRTEGPGRPSQMVAGVRSVQPPTVAVHEVVHLRGGGGPRAAQEGERAVPDAGVRRIAEDALQPDRDDQQTGHVVDAVPGRMIRLQTLRVLHDAHVVDEPRQVVSRISEVTAGVR